MVGLAGAAERDIGQVLVEQVDTQHALAELIADVLLARVGRQKSQCQLWNRPLPAMSEEMVPTTKWFQEP